MFLRSLRNWRKCLSVGLSRSCCSSRVFHSSSSLLKALRKRGGKEGGRRAEVKITFPYKKENSQPRTRGSARGWHAERTSTPWLLHVSQQTGMDSPVNILPSQRRAPNMGLIPRAIGNRSPGQLKGRRNFARIRAQWSERACVSARRWMRTSS